MPRLLCMSNAIQYNSRSCQRFSGILYPKHAKENQSVDIINKNKGSLYFQFCFLVVCRSSSSSLKLATSSAVFKCHIGLFDLPNDFNMAKSQEGKRPETNYGCTFPLLRMTGKSRIARQFSLADENIENVGTFLQLELGM